MVVGCAWITNRRTTRCFRVLWTSGTCWGRSNHTPGTGFPHTPAQSLEATCTEHRGVPADFARLEDGGRRMVCVPQARRWLSAHGMQRRMRGLVPSWVRPCSSKFAQLQRHYQRSMLADIFIDTSPWNAHSTASDALWSALRIVHQTGETFASRVAPASCARCSLAT